MKKKVIIIVVVIAILISLIPIPIHLKDGGTVEYTALLYKVSKVHSFATLEEIKNGKTYNEGIIIEILGFEVYNDVE